MKTSRKPKKPDSASSKLVLEEIIGLTTKNANGLASTISTSRCAYIAGCVVVLYDVDSAAQSHLTVSHRPPKPLTCIAVSRDGRFVAAGESGTQPAVIVWNSSTRAFMSELKGHLYGVECIAFSPDGDHLVSVGGYIYLWDWRSGLLLAKLKASSSCSIITSVSFSSDGKFIVTAGKKHLKFWTVGSSPRTRLNKETGSATMCGKPVNLGTQKGSSFVSVTSAMFTNSKSVNREQVGDLFPIYALTLEGILCLFDGSLSLRKSVDLKVEKGFALSASDKLVACACCNGTVLIFISGTLSYAGSLQHSKAKILYGEVSTDCHNKATGRGSNVSTSPDATACQFSASEKLVIVYGDHTLHVWDVHDITQATRCCVLVSHSASIWDVKTLCCENMHDPSLACVARGCSGGLSFATCSADGTIRLWDLSLNLDLAEDDPGHQSINNATLVSSGIFERDSVEIGPTTSGFRSMAASSDGKYLAAGDCEGNLHLYNLYTSNYTCFQGVHDGEILSMSFSSLSKKCVQADKATDENYLLASGGRDRTIHLYDAKRNFDIIESIDDHSAAVTSVKLTCHGCKIFSCSADRSLVLRDVHQADNSLKILRRHHQVASHGTVYDMAVDQRMEFVITVGQDKKINRFDISSGKLTRSFKQDKDFGDPIKVTMDPSCNYLVCSYTNRSMCIYDLISGEMVTHAMGHGEVINGVIFLPDCKHLVSVGGDGCIFVWKLPAHISSRILQGVKENNAPLSPKRLTLPSFSRFNFSEEKDQLCVINPKDVFLENSTQVGKGVFCQGSQKTSTFRFSISRLPNWAQAKVAKCDRAIINPDFCSSQQHRLAEQKVLSPVVDGAEGSGPSCYEVPSPARLNVGSSGSCVNHLARCSPGTGNNQNSPRLEKTQGCFAMDKRWHSVYTVCLDILNSPELKHLIDLKMPGSPSNQRNRDSATSEVHASFNVYGIPEEKNNQFGIYDSRHKTFTSDMAKQLHLDKFVNQMAETMDVDASYSKHFASLLTRHKPETSKSSLKRKYPARYTVQHDCHGGSKRLLFGTPVQDVSSKTLNDGRKVIPKNITSEDPEQREKESCKQESKNSIPTEVDGRMDCSLNSNLRQRITACHEALLNLDAAADNVVHLFSEFEAVVAREVILSGAGAKLRDEAGRLLPSIAQKVDAVSKLLKSSKFGSRERCGDEISGFESMLGTFAESLSQRVVEIVKHNLNKD